MQRHEDILSPEKARAFNPFLCAITDKLKALIVALPVHDAVIVADEDKDTTRTIMKAVFKDHTGITPQVTLG